jgi:hypothetical protein
MYVRSGALGLINVRGGSPSCCSRQANLDSRSPTICVQLAESRRAVGLSVARMTAEFKPRRKTNSEVRRMNGRKWKLLNESKLYYAVWYLEKL